MALRFFNVLVVTGLLAAAGRAETYFGTYVPSPLDPTVVSTTDPWPYEIRPLDSAGLNTTKAASAGAYATINVFNTDFNRQWLYTEFVAPTTFSATHIALGVSRTGGATDTLLAVGVQRWNDANNVWENLYTNFGGARLRAAGVPLNAGRVDLTLPFGNNQTGSPGGFSSTPATIQAGERYRVTLAHSAGAVGGVNWHYSTTAAESGAVGLDGDDSALPDNSTYLTGFNANSFTSYSDANLPDQFAFALTDGAVTAIPTPHAMLLGGAGLLAVALRRRRR